MCIVAVWMAHLWGAKWSCVTYGLVPAINYLHCCLNILWIGYYNICCICDFQWPAFISDFMGWARNIFWGWDPYWNYRKQRASCDCFCWDASKAISRWVLTCKQVIHCSQGLDHTLPSDLIYSCVFILKLVGAPRCRSNLATKWYINIDIPEVNAFRARYIDMLSASFLFVWVNSM